MTFFLITLKSNNSFIVGTEYTLRDLRDLKNESTKSIILDYYLTLNNTLMNQGEVLLDFYSIESVKHYETKHFKNIVNNKEVQIK